MNLYLLAVALILTHSLAWAQEKIRVGAWNIETLGSPYSRDYRRQSREHGFGISRRPPDLALQIRKLDLDILALQEIDDTEQDDGRATNRILDRTILILNQDPHHDWTYRLFAKRRRQSDIQHTGLAWNRKRVRSLGRPFRVPVTDINRRKFALWDRHPHAMKFTRGPGRTDFVVIPIHMKAGNRAEAVQQREKEAQALVARLPEIRHHFQDNDIILIGDFNLLHGSEPAGRVYRTRGHFLDLNDKDRSTHISGLPLDRCYIPRDQRKREFTDVTHLQIAAPAKAAQHDFRRNLSDHWPIILEFAEQTDDD